MAQLGSSMNKHLRSFVHLGLGRRSGPPELARLWLRRTNLRRPPPCSASPSGQWLLIALFASHFHQLLKLYSSHLF